MLARLKFKIDGLVNEMLDQLPQEIWTDETKTFLDPAMAGGQFLKEIISRLRAAGHSDENIAGRVFGVAEDIIDLNYARKTAKLIGKYGIGGYDFDYEGKFGMKKFDVIVGNPPYNRGILHPGYKSKIARGNASIAFIEKVIEMVAMGGVCSLVLPTNFMTLPSMKAARDYFKSTIQISKIKIYDNTNNQIFPIDNDNILVLTFSKTSDTDNANVIIEREHFITKENNKVIVNINDYDFWPMYLSEIELNIFKKVFEQRTGPISFTPSDNFIFLAVMGDNNSKNHTKHWVLNKKRDSVKCGVMLYFETQNKAELYFKFTKTPLYNMILNQVKSTPKNQPEVLSYIGNFNFKDDNFYSFFNLTNEEIEYIEEIMK